MYDASASRYFPIGRMRPDDSPTMRTRVIPKKMRNDVIFVTGFYAINVTSSEYAMCRGTFILPWSMKKAHSVKVLFSRKPYYRSLNCQTSQSDRWIFTQRKKLQWKRERKGESMILIIQIYVLLYTLSYFK